MIQDITQKDDCQKMRDVLNELIEKNTEKDGLDDMDKFETVRIGEESPFMTLHVSKQTSKDIRVSHYIDDNARKPDPQIRFNDEGDGFEPVFMEQVTHAGKAFTKDKSEIKDFVNNTWADNLKSQQG